MRDASRHRIRTLTTAVALFSVGLMPVVGSSAQAASPSTSPSPQSAQAPALQDAISKAVTNANELSTAGKARAAHAENVRDTGRRLAGSPTGMQAARPAATPGTRGPAHLAASGSISGKVSGAQGVGANAVKVEVSTDGIHWTYSTSTEADGAYTLAAVPPGTYFVHFTRVDDSTDYLTTWLTAGSAIRSVTVHSGQALTGLDVTMAQGGSVAGSLSMPPLPSGSAAPEAQVYAALWAPDGNLVSATSIKPTDTSYRLHGVPAGTYSLAFAGYGGANVAPIAQQVTVGDGATVTADISLTTGAQLTGKALTSTGTPAVNRLVCFQSDAFMCDMSDATGAYELSSLPEASGTISVQDLGSDYEDATYYPGVVLASKGTVVTTTPGQTTPLADMREAPRAKVTGTVSGAQDPFVSLFDSDGRMVGGDYGDSYTATPPATPVRAYAGDFIGSSVGRWWPGTTAKSSAGTIELSAGATRSGTNFSLTASGGSTVSGIVPSFLRSQSSGGLFVAAMSSDLYFIKGVVASSTGAFALRGLAPGSYTLMALGGTTLLSSTTADVTVTAGSSVSTVNWKVDPDAISEFVQRGTPTISGTFGPGYTVTAAPGTWVPTTLAYRYQWLADGQPIPGATSRSLLLPPSTAFKRISVQVTGTRYFYRNATATSAITSPLPGYLNAPTPRISGTPAVGGRLTRVLGTWTPAAATYSYQWKRNGVAIPGASAASYQLTSADRGAVITLTVVGRKPGYSSRWITSAGTPRIR